MSCKIADYDIKNIFNDYSKLVQSICRKMIRDRELSEDAFQESWYEIIKSIKTFKGKSDISTWIYSVAYRTVCRVVKNEKSYSLKFIKRFFDAQKDKSIEIEFHDRIEEKIWIKEQCTKCLNGILYCLDNQKRLIFILRDVMGLDYSAISGIINMNQACIRKINSRNRRKLKNFLNDHCVLFNPDSVCCCKIKKIIDKSEIAAERDKLKRSIKNIYDWCDGNAEVKSDFIKEYLSDI